MSSIQLLSLLDSVAIGNRLWFAKRLAANDTLATNAHQAGPYFPKSVVFEAFPVLDRPDQKNPDLRIGATVQGVATTEDIRVIWYNGKVFGDGTRDECRFTNFGGRSSPVLDPESTGSIAVFSFKVGDQGVAEHVDVWVCNNPDEEIEIESRVGEIPPGAGVCWRNTELGIPEFVPIGTTRRESSCWLNSSEIPAAWFERFPKGSEIIARVFEMRSCKGLDADRKLIKRRDCEYQLFQSVEEATTLPLIRQGFSDLPSFLAVAQSVLQRRKSRSGMSLELHLRRVFEESGLHSGSGFDHGKVSEGNKKPDFLFPSVSAYRDESYSSSRLRMLGVKTSCKDRWRQVLSEADRIKVKHLMTLQEGVSEAQFAEMCDNNLRLVVPVQNIKRFPKSVRPELQTVQSFIDEVRSLAP